MKGLSYKKTKKGIIFNIKVQPRSAKTEVIGVHDNILKVKVTSAPEGGKANKQVIELISRYFNVKKSSVKIIKGETSSLKLIEIEGLKNL